MSTLRTDYLESLDETFTRVVKDIPSSSALAADTLPARGADLIGYKNNTVGEVLDLIVSANVYYADNFAPSNNLQMAFDSLPSNSVLIIRTPFTYNTNIVLDGKDNVTILFQEEGSLTASGTMVYKTGYRGALVFDSCTNIVVRAPRITGFNQIKVETGTIPSFQRDGDAGIEFISCNTTRVLGDYKGLITNFMSWGVIHIMCVDTLVDGLTITNCTQQSGVGHAGVTGGIVSNCTISNIGLYGVEVEGADTNVRVFSNNISNCYIGIAMVSSLNSCSAYNNIVELCTFGVSLNANTSSSDVGNSVVNNFIYDCLIHLSITDTNFADVTGNRSLGRVAAAWLRQRPADFIWLKESPNFVLIPDYEPTSIIVGQQHLYGTSIVKTVSTVALVADPIMGNCAKVSYTEGTSDLTVGQSFRRNTSLIGSSSKWAYFGPGGLNHIEFSNNYVNAPVENGAEFIGSINELHWADNRMRQVKNNLVAADSTPLTNSTILLSQGDFTDNTGIFSGAAQGKLYGSLKAQSRSVSMGKAPSSTGGFTVAAGSIGFKIKLTIFGSSAATAPVILNLNNSTVITIPASDFGLGTPVYREVVISSAANTYSYDLQGGGAMTVTGVFVETELVLK